MLENLARWIFELRPQVLGFLSALTMLASFYATRITLEGVHPDGPPSDPGIKIAAESYSAAFPETRTLAVFAKAAEGARLDSIAGAAWLDRVQAALQGLRMPASTGPEPERLVVEEASPLQRVAADGRTALIEAPIRPEAALDMNALGAALSALSEASGPGSPYRLTLLTPVPAPSALSIWVSSVGPLIAGAALLAAGLLAYSASFALTALVAGAALLAMLWQIGAWATMGGHFYAGMRLIPLLVFALVLGHGFPIARHVMRVLAAGASPAEAAASLVRRLAPAGGAALLAVALALAAAALTPVADARAALIFGSLGAFFAFPALYIVLPLLMVAMPIDRPPPAAAAETAPRRPRRIKSDLSLRQTPAGPQTIAILAAALALIAGLEAHTRLFGPIDAAGLKTGSGTAWIDVANAAAAGPGSTLASLSIVGRTSPDACLSFDVLDAMDRLSWRLANLPGVTFVDSLSFKLRALQADAHGGNPRWNGLPGASVGALQSMIKIPESEALYDKQCRTLIIRVFAAPPFAPVLSAVDAAVTQFRAENAPGAISFEPAGGPLANALSEQRLLSHAQTGLFLAIMTALAAVAFFSLKDWRAATAMSVMGLALFLAAGWAVAAIPLGLTGLSVPLVLFTLLLPADMAIYVLMGWRAADAAVGPDGEQPRRRLWQRDGRALASRALSLLLCFTVWLAASDPLARSLGVLAIVTTLTGTLTALILIPAASMLAERGLSHRPALAG